MSNEERVGKPLQEFEGVVPPQLPHLKTHDEFGLSLDPKHWAKSKCTTCYGNGVYVVTRNVPASQLAKGAVGGDNKVTVTDPCYCALHAYQRVRKPLQDRVLAVWHHPNLSEEKKMDGIKALVEEALKQVKNAGTITDIKAMITAADHAARSMIQKPRR